MIAGIFGLAAGGSQDFLALASLLATLGVGVGGNLPVDSAVFLGEGGAASLAPLRVADDHGRLCPRFASIPPHGPVHLVVARAALREPGELSPVCRRACLLSKLRTTQIAWPLIANFSCSPNAPAGSCTRSENMGWRYLLFTLGGCTLLLWAFRFFVFKLEESPRFLAGRGLDAEAAAVVQRIAAFNGLSLCFCFIFILPFVSP